jgi:hypothetical protein
MYLKRGRPGGAVESHQEHNTGFDRSKAGSACVRWFLSPAQPHDLECSIQESLECKISPTEQNTILGRVSRRRGTSRCLGLVDSVGMETAAAAAAVSFQPLFPKWNRPT